MRGNLGLFVSSADRVRLAAIIADRNSPQKHVWRAQVVLMTGDRVGTSEIMRRTGLGKVSVWRWQERYVDEGVDGLLRDKTRPSRIPKLAAAKVAEVIRRTQEEAVASHGNTVCCLASNGYSIRHGVAPRRGIHPLVPAVKLLISHEYTGQSGGVLDGVGAEVGLDTRR
jgi:transposase